MKTEVQKLAGLTEDIRLEENQREFLKRWVKHLRTYKTEEQIVDLAYTVRELGLFVKKPYESVSPEELDSYLGFKLKNEESITGNRVLNLRKSSILCYRYRINSFYRWAIKHTSLSINQELAYPRPKIVKKIEKSREQQCKDRVLVLLDNKVIDTNRKEDRSLDENNLLILNDFYNYKITSGKVESHTGFISKLCFLKRLGLYLKKRTKNYKEATREDIQGFLSEIQKSLVDKKEKNSKVLINSSYKAHLLDFYRFIYEMFEEEQPRKYPAVVSWLYQKRKKGHDKLLKEVILDSEIRLMIDKCSETRDKALIALMADCSGRVGEIINTNLEDIKIQEVNTEKSKYNHTIATITLRGKTGERTNQLFYSVPYLRLWLLNHPLKEDNKAPLFIATKENRYGQRLSAVGINKILQRATRRAEIKRHIHAHLFRHTNITRMAKILSETELKIHSGWGSNSKMASVYVHLKEEDVANKILETYGIIPKKKEEIEDLLKKKICPNNICSYENISEAKFCLKCGYPLSLKTAVSLNKIKKKEEALQNELFSKDISNVTEKKDIREAMYEILRSDPKLIERLKEIIELTAEVSQ